MRLKHKNMPQNNEHRRNPSPHNIFLSTWLCPTQRLYLLNLVFLKTPAHARLNLSLGNLSQMGQGERRQTSTIAEIGQFTGSAVP